MALFSRIILVLLFTLATAFRAPSLGDPAAIRSFQQWVADLSSRSHDETVPTTQFSEEFIQQGVRMLAARADVLRNLTTVPLHDSAIRHALYLCNLLTASDREAIIRALPADVTARFLERRIVDGSTLDARVYFAMARAPKLPALKNSTEESADVVHTDSTSHGGCATTVRGTIHPGDLTISRIVTMQSLMSRLQSNGAVGFPIITPAFLLPTISNTDMYFIDQDMPLTLLMPATSSPCNHTARQACLKAFREGERLRDAALGTDHQSPIHHDQERHLASSSIRSHHSRALDTIASEWSSGVQSLLAIRAVFTGQSASAIDISLSDFQTAVNGLVSYHSRNSYGNVTLVATITTCVYVMNISQTGSYATTNEDTIYQGLLWAAPGAQTASGSSSTCTSIDPLSYQHFVAYIPPLGYLPWAGIAVIPGRRTIINGDQGDTNIGVLAHEVGHTFGLMHANVFDARFGTDESNAEYGDITDIMGSGSRSTFISADGGSYDPGDFNPGYKAALHWMPPSVYFDANIATLAATRNNSAATILLAAADTGSLATAGTVATPSCCGVTTAPVYLAARTATPDGWSARELFLSYRHLWPTATSGILLHEVTAGWVDSQYSPYPTWNFNRIGNAYLRDTQVSSVTLNDAHIPPGDAYVYSAGAYGGGAPRLLIENRGRVTLPPASTSADSALAVRLQWLDPVSGTRPEGLGCDTVSGACVNALPSVLPSIACGSSSTISLVAPSTIIGVWGLRSPISAPSGQMLQLSTCSSATSVTALAAHIGIGGISTPVGAAYFGASIARGAFAYSNFTPSVGGSSVSLCGTLQLSFGPGAEYTIAVSAASLPASVTLSASCASSLSCNWPGSRLLSVTGFDSAYNSFNGLYQITEGAPLSNSALQWTNQGLGSGYQFTRLRYSGSYWIFGASTWPEGNWNDITGSSVYVDSDFTSNVDPRTATGWSGSYAQSSVSITCACPANTVQAYPGAACRGCPGGNMYAVAGTTDGSQCGCYAGWGYNATTGGCSLCPANTFRQGYTSTDTCVPCPAGTTSSPGSTSVLSCTPTSVCDQITISSSNGLDGTYVAGTAGTSQGYPYWYCAARDMYLAFQPNFVNPYVSGQYGAWAFLTGSPVTGPNAAVAYTRDFPHLWNSRANYASIDSGSMFFDGGIDTAPGSPASITCSCTGGGTPLPTGRCPIATPLICPDGYQLNGGGTACVACGGSYFIAGPSSCVCPSSYVVSGGGSICSPPDSINITATDTLSGKYTLSDSPMVTVNGTLTPVYVKAMGGPGGSTVVFSYRSDRREWSLAPTMASNSSVPRYAFLPPTAPGAGTVAIPFGVGLPLVRYNPASYAFDDMSVSATIILTVPSLTPTSSVTPSNTPSSSGTSSNTPTASVTPSNTPTASVTPSHTPTASVTPSHTPTASVTPSQTPTASVTPSHTPTHLPVLSPASPPPAATGSNVISFSIRVRGCTQREFLTASGTSTAFTTAASTYLGLHADQVQIVSVFAVSDNSRRRVLTTGTSTEVAAKVYLEDGNVPATLVTAISSAAFATAVEQSVAPVLGTSTGRDSATFTADTAGNVVYQSAHGTPLAVPSPASSSSSPVISTTTIIIIAVAGGGGTVLVGILVAVALYTRSKQVQKQLAAQRALETPQQQQYQHGRNTSNVGGNTGGGVILIADPLPAATVVPVGKGPTSSAQRRTSRAAVPADVDTDPSAPPPQPVPSTVLPIDYGPEGGNFVGVNPAVRQQFAQQQQGSFRTSSNSPANIQRSGSPSSRPQGVTPTAPRVVDV